MSAPIHHPPHPQNVANARDIARDLIDVATGTPRHGNYPDLEQPLLSAADRLTIIAARVGEIAGLLTGTWIHDEEEAA
jgi:hypothetical protein